MTMHVKGVGLKFPDGTEQTTAAVGGPGDGTGGSGVYTKDETDAKLATKANVGVSYTKAEADILVDEKADTGVSYTKAETEDRLATKADVADLESAMASAVPTGMIMLWSGSTGSVPSGWRLCDGAGGTPNLRDKFIVGAGSAYAVNATGGSADAVAVSHNHTGSTSNTGAHTHGAGTYNISTGGDAGQNSTSGAVWRNEVWSSTKVKGSSASAGAHAHTFTTSTNGVAGTGKNLPPYYALCYIMKL